MVEFEEALRNFKTPPYHDPDVNPKAPESSGPSFHDEDTFSEYNEHSYGGWDWPPYDINYYYLVIHTLLKNGAVPAPLNIRQAYDSLSPEEQVPSEFYMNKMGWRRINNHERSGAIRRAIEDIIGSHIDLEKFWLLPVENDNEYVSWHFTFVPRNEDLVMKQIISLSMGDEGDANEMG